jgi:hypothetical protein
MPDTLTRQTHTISPLAQVPFFFFEKGNSEAIEFFFEKHFSRENLPEIPSKSLHNITPT